jgi:hypothetical protein
VKGKGTVGSKAEEEESEGLALLIPDIQHTANIVNLATQRLKDAEGRGSIEDAMEVLMGEVGAGEGASRVIGPLFLVCNHSESLVYMRNGNTT